MTDSTPIRIDEFIYHNGLLSVKFQTDIYIELIVELFELVVKDQQSSTSDNVILKSYRLFYYTENDGSYVLQYPTGSLDLELTEFNAALLYNGKQVTTGDIHLQQEMDDLMNNLNRESFIESSAAIQLPIEQAAKQYSIIVTGMSQCPYYTDYINQYVGPFYTKYANIARYIHYEFVSFSKYNNGTFMQSISMHG